MPVPIFQPSEIKEAKVLIFGNAGSGKTRFLGTANDDPRTSPMLILDFEGGTSSLRGRAIDVMRMTSWDDFSTAYDFLVSGKHEYKSVAIDSLSEVHIMALLARLKPEPGQRARKQMDLIEQADYGIALTQMRRFVRYFRDLPYHVFMTSLVREDTDPREGLVRKPGLPGAFADEVQGIFESVTFLSMAEIDNVPTRVLVLQNMPKVRTKVRTPIGFDPPDYIASPTVGALLDAMGL